MSNIIFCCPKTSASAVRSITFNGPQSCALTAYHWVYRESLQPWLVADLLILRDEMPRSLASCYEAIVRNLDSIAGAYGRQGPAQRQARGIRTRLQNSRMDGIFQRGLHEFIGEFIVENNKLGALITEQFLT